ncbi:MAG: RNA 2',3'-cyclic phosphodiesterase [bacterium]|nr:RNA 2',3'-cyclic phosphodiesterase [bacterium]
MRHRIFIAINLPENIKKKLADYQSKWPDLPARWTRQENLHITLAFLGDTTDEELLEVLETTKEAAEKHEPFFINLKKITYGPPNGSPRMVWAEGEKSEELAKLSAELNIEQGKGYTPHITLARLKTWELKQMETEERPEINEDINFNFEVASIEIMESELKRGGPSYTILESCPLKEV